MSFSKVICAVLLLVIAGCGTDLVPSGHDQRPPVQASTLGAQVGQLAPDFTVYDSLGNIVSLSSVLSSPTTSGVVLYFTMWCPVCTSNMNAIQGIMPGYQPRVSFFAVDYVSATVAQARAEEIAYGLGSGFVVLADTNRNILTNYNATMDITVVIDKNGVIRMNETFKSDKLQSVLAALP